MGYTIKWYVEYKIQIFIKMIKKKDACRLYNYLHNLLELKLIYWKDYFNNYVSSKYLQEQKDQLLSNDFRISIVLNCWSNQWSHMFYWIPTASYSVLNVGSYVVAVVGSHCFVDYPECSLN